MKGIHKQKKYFSIWNGINVYRYMAGIQKSLKKKITVYKALYKKFGIWPVYKPRKAIWSRPFFAVLSLDKCPKRLEVSILDLQTKTCDGNGQARTDMRKFQISGKINQCVWYKKESRNERRTKLIAEKRYYVLFCKGMCID